MTDADPRIAYFDALAAGWDDAAGGPAAAGRLASHADLLGLRAGQRLLEVGCGTGKSTAWLAAQVAPGRVTAIDFAPQMLAKAAAKGIDADFAPLDACADDLGQRRYDVILCFHSFPHFRDQAAALRRFRRALRPAGRLIVMHLAGSQHINRFHAGLDGPVRRDALPVGDQWPPLLAEAGLRLTKIIDREDLFFLAAAPQGAPSGH
jgi:SAM-dependent methyltransferase